MSRSEFIEHYLPFQEQNMARHLLPEAVKSLEEWRSLWNRMLNSPAI